MSVITTNTPAYPLGLAIEGLTRQGGAVIALVPGATVWQYSSSLDNGATWAVPAPLPGNPLVAHTSCARWTNTGELWLFYAGAGTGVPIGLYRCQFTAGAPGSGHASSMNPIAAATSYDTLDAAWDPTGQNWHVGFCFGKSGGARSVGAVVLDPDTPTTADLLTVKDLAVPVTTTSDMFARFVAAGGSIYLYLAFADLSRDGITLLPVTYSAAFGYRLATSDIESVYQSLSYTAFSGTTVLQAHVVVEAGGTLTFVIHDVGALVARSRPASKTYGAVLPLTTSVTGQHRVVRDAGTSALYVFVASTANQANGELMVVPRQPTWGAPLRVAGGDAAGYSNPLVAGFVTSGAIDLAYITGTPPSADTLLYSQEATSGAPQAPVVTAPVGSTATLTPTVTWRSQTLAPADPVGGRQVLVHRISDAAVMWDSGDVAGSTPALGYGSSGSPVALAYNVAYGIQVRERDSITGGGAGTYGPYSAVVVFTPYRPGTVGISSLQIGIPPVTAGSTPAAVGSGYLGVHASWTQPDGNAANAYRLRFTDATDAPLLTGPATPLAVPVPSGGTLVVPQARYVLPNSSTLHLYVDLQDAVTGIWNASPAWELDVVYVPPPAPTAFVVTADRDHGTALATWDAGGSEIQLEWRAYSAGGVPGSWQVLVTGKVWTQATLFPTTLRRYDYRLCAISVDGLQSAYVEQDAITLQDRAARFAVWLNDLADPLTYSVALGGIADSWSITSEEWNPDLKEWVPVGESVPFQSFGLSDWWGHADRQTGAWFIPYDSVLADGSRTYGEDTLLALRQLASRMQPLLYRTPRGTFRYVVMVNYFDQNDDPDNMQATFALHSTGYDPPDPAIPVPPVVGS